MKLIVISGRSGSGKSVALHVLEDLGFYCIDNLPIGLLASLVEQVLDDDNQEERPRVAVSIDARNLSADLQQFPNIVSQLDAQSVDCEVVYLDASEETLYQRYSATRRKHPLSNNQISLSEAIRTEKRLLEPIADLAHLSIDTSSLTLHQLRDLVSKRVAQKIGHNLALLFESFGFKHGVPLDADLVFDVRCLPNPYWDPELRGYNGQDQPVIDFLRQHTSVQEMQEDIRRFLARWLERFEANNRSYMTVAIGCTGGQHRSVYLTEQLGRHFSHHFDNVQIRHRELS